MRDCHTDTHTGRAPLVASVSGGAVRLNAHALMAVAEEKEVGDESAQHSDGGCLASRGAEISRFRAFKKAPKKTQASEGNRPAGGMKQNTFTGVGPELYNIPVTLAERGSNFATKLLDRFGCKLKDGQTSH